jgi:hypothetical protein
VKGNDLAAWHDGIFGITTVKGSTHPTNHRNNLLSRLQVSTWAESTTPVASMPITRGKVTADANPNRVCSSERFKPKALTLILTQPEDGSSTGRFCISRFSTGPGPFNTIARIVVGITFPLFCSIVFVYLFENIVF